MRNWWACLDEDLWLFQWFEACRLNRPSPELRRLWRLQRAIFGVVSFSNPQAVEAKPQDTCGSRRYQGRRNVGLGNRLEQQWEPESNLLWCS